MFRTLVPSPCKRAATLALAPLPSATTRITAPTPMMMPSMVKKERVLLAPMASMAVDTLSRIPSRCTTRKGTRLDGARGTVRTSCTELMPPALLEKPAAPPGPPLQCGGPPPESHRPLRHHEKRRCACNTEQYLARG